ncbi:hypothetical protein CEXT_465091 [Caerostris extrusa]|uniref:Uncharacterized protein n=1 Tax=Caerostris extrusa TaxID=172846 RepID=A0AAV4YGI7_CAEEX|nr:hypothetical protein CEXT_465091 [Caerostris extrusa]
MKSFLTALFLVSLAISVLADVDPLINKFMPACGSLQEAIVDKVREMDDNDELSGNNCQEEKFEDCMIQDVEKVQCALAEGATDECLQQIASFLKRDRCNQ